MMVLVLSALALLLATAPALAADPPKAPTATPSQGAGPAIQSDAVKPLTQPNVVTPPAAKPVPPPTPGGGPAVSGPKTGPRAPAAGPTVPTIPAGGVPGIDPSLRDANQLDAIRDLKQLDQLNRDPLQRGRPAGTGDDGPFNPQTLGRGIEQSPGHQGPDGYFRDCFPNPQDCISGGARDRSAPGNAGDRLGAPPTAAGGVPDPRGVAADGSWRERGLRQTWDGTRSARAVHEDTHGNTTSIRIERTPLETRNQPTTAQDETHRTTIVIVVSRGDRDVAEHRQVITHNSKGDVVENGVSDQGDVSRVPQEVRDWVRHASQWVFGERDDPPPTRTGPVRASGGGPDSQPSEAPPEALATTVATGRPSTAA